MYDRAGITGRRIGALFLDGLIISFTIGLCYFISPNLGLIIGGCGTVLYYGICEGSSLRATLGKAACGLMVVDDYGRPLTYQKSFVRSLCRILSGVALGIGYLMGLFSEDGKALHDILAHTRVVPRAASGVNGGIGRYQPAPAGYPRLLGVAGQLAGQTFSFPGLEMVLGKDRSCTMIVYGSGVSRRHCRIVYEPSSRIFYLYDIGSSYGTYLANGYRVRQDAPAPLRPGEEFWLGEPANRFRVVIN